MSTILIVEDHAMSRQVLKSLFGYLGHRVLEAADGTAALTLARSERPDLIISDIVMPTMDGTEFVRLLRREKALERIPVIFYTAMYRLPEALRISGSALGECRVIPKPSDPQFILKTVNELLGIPLQAPAAAPAKEPPRLSVKSDGAGLQLAAVIDLSFHLVGQRDPARLLATFSRAIREILNCRQAYLTIREYDGQKRYFIGNEKDELPQSCPINSFLWEGISSYVMEQRSPFRWPKETQGDTDSILPRVPFSFHSLMAIPFSTTGRVYGWLCLIDKVDSAPFSIDDEEMAVALSAQAALAYENILLIEELRRSRDELEIRVQERTRELTGEIEVRKRAEDALRESEKELRHLSSQLLVIHEKERREIAGDLHDNIWQILNTLKFDIDDFLSRQAAGNLPAARQSTQRIHSNIRDAIERIRTMQGDLWPPTLDDIGMLATINWYCRKFEKDHAGISVEKKVRVTEEEIPAHIKIVIYRVMQEALKNVAQHSTATRVSISLKKNGEGIEFAVSDNGKGFDLDRVPFRTRPWIGLGLVSMRERIEHSGGTFDVRSGDGTGTIIRASWPLTDTRSIEKE
jgi:signal transduction histidine kinase/ActR/RegA family two-component response regulator